MTAGHLLTGDPLLELMSSGEALVVPVLTQPGRPGAPPDGDRERRG